MVDAERLSRLLARVLADVEAIRDTARTADPLSDPIRLRAIKYGFVTALEGCVRAAQHVVASEHLTMPESNTAAVRVLRAHGVVDVDVADPVARAVGFRNVLVHEYAEVDDARVVANLCLLPELEAYVTQLSRWAVGRSGRRHGMVGPLDGAGEVSSWARRTTAEFPATTRVGRTDACTLLTCGPCPRAPASTWISPWSPRRGRWPSGQVARSSNWRSSTPRCRWSGRHCGSPD